MTSPLQSTSAVMDVIRGFLLASRSSPGAAEAAERLLAETSRQPLVHLDLLERLIRTELWYEKPDVTLLGRFAERHRRRPLTWLDLCSADGYVRERAMRCLVAEAPNALFLALALRRLNDWVPQVRKAAREHLPAIAEGSSPEHVAEAIWSLLPHAGSWGRMDDEDRAVINTITAMEPVALALKARIVGSAAGPGSAVLAQLGRTPAFDRWLAEFARASTQPSVRARAYRALFEGRMVWVVGRRWVWIDPKWGTRKLEVVLGERAIAVEAPFLATLKQALGDRSPLVRRVGAEFLIRQMDALGDEAVPLLEVLAADRAPYVAERGRFALERRAGTR